MSVLYAADSAASDKAAACITAFYASSTACTLAIVAKETEREA